MPQNIISVNADLIDHLWSYIVLLQSFLVNGCIGIGLDIKLCRKSIPRSGLTLNLWRYRGPKCWGYAQISFIWSRVPHVLRLGWSALCFLIGHTFFRTYFPHLLRGGWALGFTHPGRDWPAGGEFPASSPPVREVQVARYKYRPKRGKQNEPRHQRVANAAWSQWARCCNKHYESQPEAPSLCSSGWRGALRECPPGTRRPGPSIKCPDQLCSASLGTCSPKGGCPDCTSYRYGQGEDA